MQGKLDDLQEPMRASKAIYDAARKKLKKQDGFPDLLGVHARRDNNLVQDSDDFDIVFKRQAPEAQEKLRSLISTKWVPDEEHRQLFHPAPGFSPEWVDLADDPGSWRVL